MGAHKKILNEEERNVFLSKFNQINEILSSNISNDEKVYQILLIYSTIKKFENDYNYFLDKCGEYEGSNLDIIKLQNIYSKLLEYEKSGLISNVKYVIKMKDKIDNYDYAEYIITAYLTKDNSYIPYFFYKDMNIDEKIFNYCIKIIRELNPALYHKYEQRKVENIEKRYYNRVNSIKEIAKGIKTGSLSDGTSFDILIFWKLVPFKYFHTLQMELYEYHDYVNSKITLLPGSTLYNNIQNFSNAANIEEAEIVLEYMKQNNIKGFKYITCGEVISDYKKTFTQKKILSNGEMVDVEFGEEDVKKIFKYIRYYQLPSIVQVFNVLRDRYLKGENLDVPEVEKRDTVPLILDDKKEQQKQNIKKVSIKKY